jgi:hypothetical protein
MAVPGIKSVAGAASAAGEKVKKLKAELAGMLGVSPPKAPDPPETMIPAGGVPQPKSAEGFTLAPLEEGDPSDVDQQLEDWGSQWEKSNAYQRVAGEGVRDYVARLRSMAADDKHKPGVARAIGELESRFARLLGEGKVGPIEAGPEDVPAETTLKGKVDAAKRYTRNQITRDYTDYLAANGVDQRTIDAILSGELPMNPTARAERASMMGLDPNAVWHRWDYPLKTQFKGYTGAALSKPEYTRSKKGALSFVDLAPSKEGLVYASHSPEYAKLGVQVPKDQIVQYQLLAPREGIAGLDRLPPEAYDAFRERQVAAAKGP